MHGYRKMKAEGKVSIVKTERNEPALKFKRYNELTGEAQDVAPQRLLLGDMLITAKNMQEAYRDHVEMIKDVVAAQVEDIKNIVKDVPGIDTSTVDELDEALKQIKRIVGESQKALD